MSFFDWVASIRKKPLETRRRIAIIGSLWTMGIVTVVWFGFFFSTLPERFNSVQETQGAATESARSPFSNFELPPFPEFPSSRVPAEPEKQVSTSSQEVATSSPSERSF